ncbi:MAG TPA: hypothetical protein EYP53_04405 [Candidatus Latescibacteria bacterium]|nr:hypothetical protein [Candidatus Latescibacterota bacterium]
MVEEGFIVDVRGGKAVVSMRRNPACDHCNLCLFRPGGQMSLEAENPVGAKVGDRVKVRLTGVSPLRASFLVYMVPLVSFVLGFIVAAAISGSEVVGGLVGAGGLVLSFILLHRYDKSIGRRGDIRPRILQVLSVERR